MPDRTRHAAPFHATRPQSAPPVRRHRPGGTRGTPWDRDATSPGTEHGLVVASHGRLVKVRASDGAVFKCRVRPRTPAVVTGDRVRWHRTGRGDGQVAAIEPRRTLLARPEPGGRLRPVAANLDRIFVVVAPRPAFQDTLLDRFLATAEHVGAEPAVVLNKVDLLDPEERQAFAGHLAPYEDIGYPITVCSAGTGEGLERLRAALAGHTSILVGASGVGKSSLASRIVPGAAIATGALSRGQGQGRHTTSAATLYDLPGGGALVDSPGVREFGMWHLEPRDAAGGFREFHGPATGCRFRDCLHREEPGCGVRAAAQRGEIHGARYASYLRLLEETGAAGY